MDGTSSSTSLTAESGAQNNTTSTPNVASVTDADKLINNKIDSAQVEGKAEEELLKDLLTDSYCHVCEAVLLFESQRLSHYEGKKHAQKLKVYLQTKKADKLNTEPTGAQWTMPNDRDRFCELCNMVFSSPMVARSHYEGKVHTKNLRKQSLHPAERPTEKCTLPSLPQDPDSSDQKSSSEDIVEHVVDPAITVATSSTEVDLKDPNKYCPLCTASFNTPQIALQHYNGRKHQRNHARQELLKQLGHNLKQANSLMCQMCSLQFNSVEMYQAHMQGNKHQTREKKVIDLCKSQQKVYNTFADELADYIQVQKARGITPKTNQVLPQDDTQKEDDDEAEEEEQEVLNRRDMQELHKPMPNLPPTSNSPHQPHPGHYYAAQMGCPSFQGPPLPTRGWNYNYPPPVLLNSGPAPVSSWPMKRKRHRRSSSSSYTTSLSSSSSYSSYSSSESDSDHSEYRHREKRRIKTSRREKDRRGRYEDSDSEERRRRYQRKERDSKERRREQSVESEEDEGRRKKLKIHGKRRRKEKKSHKENFEVERGDRVMDRLKPEDMMMNRGETELHIQAEINVKQREGGEGEPTKLKYRKEKKKAKERVDTRTEEEKLWDDSILGC